MSSNGCSLPGGVIWNTCDNRPMVRIGGATECTVITDTTTTESLSTQAPVTIQQVAHAVKGGMLLDKACLPKLGLAGADLSAMITTPPTDEVGNWMFGKLDESCVCEGA